MIFSLQGCVKKDRLLLYYDDGEANDRRLLSDSGHAIFFKSPKKGKYAIQSVRFWAIREGVGDGMDKNIILSICDENMETIYEAIKPHALVDTNSAKWRNIDVEPPQYCPDKFWVIIDTNSAKNAGIFIGVDEDISRSHSKSARAGSAPMDLPGTFEWMIRVKLQPLDESGASKPGAEYENTEGEVEET